MTPRALFHPARLARRPVLSTQSDERLVDLARAGSDPAFEAIVERYRRALMRYVSRLLPPERAEDVVQQSFVKAYEAMHRDAAELNLRPWLYRIAHNGALNALRDRALGHAELDERIDGVERPDQAFERAAGLRELLVAVQALPERQRDAILLRELEGRSYEEIAAALGVTDGAVRQLLNRARNSLRAAAAAVVPGPLVARVAASADSAEPVAARMAELVGVGARRAGDEGVRDGARDRRGGGRRGGRAGRGTRAATGERERTTGAEDGPSGLTGRRRPVVRDVRRHCRRGGERDSGERGERRERRPGAGPATTAATARAGAARATATARTAAATAAAATSVDDHSGPGGGDDRSGHDGGDNSGPGGGGQQRPGRRWRRARDRRGQQRPGRRRRRARRHRAGQHRPRRRRLVRLRERRPGPARDGQTPAPGPASRSRPCGRSAPGLARPGRDRPSRRASGRAGRHAASAA